MEGLGLNRLFGGAYAGRRVLVTGHTGFKGSWLSEWLLSLGAEVAGFAIGLPYSPCHFEVLKLAGRMRHVEGDVRSLAALMGVFEAFRPEVVFHLAAQSLVRRSFDEPTLTIETNALGTLNVLEAIRRTPSVKAAVLVTSDKCYHNNGWDFGYRETDQLGGEDPYSASKACAELIAYSYAHSYFHDTDTPRIATARAGNVIGGGDWAQDRIVPDCVRAWSERKPALIRNPHSTRPWQHVLEPLSGYLWLGCQLARFNPKVRGEAFNFGPNPTNNQTVLALATEMQKSWDRVSWEIGEPAEEGKVEARLLQLNCDKARQRLQWRPALDFPEAVGLTVDWYRQYYTNPIDAASCTRDQIQLYETLASERLLPWALAEQSVESHSI